MDTVLEKESNRPFMWKSNTILIRNEKNEIVEIEIPNDEED